jgi:hypothetical protein
MSERLSYFLKISKDKTPIDLQKELMPVVERIEKNIPSKVTRKLFSSSKNETGGKIKFPYCRVDSNLSIIDMMCSHTFKNNSRSEKRKRYQRACKYAFKVLVWVEIGFGGLENLAKNRASVNWTAGVGHLVNDEERVVGIMTAGQSQYERALKAFVSYRLENGIKSDLFSKYKLEFLLDQFK